LIFTQVARDDKESRPRRTGKPSHVETRISLAMLAFGALFYLDRPCDRGALSNRWWRQRVILRNRQSPAYDGDDRQQEDWPSVKTGPLDVLRLLSRTFRLWSIDYESLACSIRAKPINAAECT